MITGADRAAAPHGALDPPLSCLVLTAGLGSRLDPLTRLVAKPAVPLAGAPLIERVLHWLRRQGVVDVVLNLHHRPDTVTAVTGDGAHLGIRLRYSWEQPVLGSAGGPRHALPLLDSDPILIVNGDTLCDTPLAPMLAAHRQSGAAVTMALVRNPAPDHYNGVVVDASGAVSGVVPKGTADTTTWHFIGIQIAERAVFAELSDGTPAETVSQIYQPLMRQGRVRAWAIDTPFIDVGTPADYWQAAVTIAGRGEGSLIDPGADVSSSARLQDTVVWAGARIDGDAVLEDCIVAGPVTVPAGFTARRAILVPAALVRPNETADVTVSCAAFPLS